MTSAAVLCVINTDEDVLIIPTNCCRKCLESKLKCVILKEIRISTEYLKESKDSLYCPTCYKYLTIEQTMNSKKCLQCGEKVLREQLIRGVNPKCLCHQSQIEKICATRGDGEWGLHWIICRQYLRRHNKKLSQKWQFAPLEKWKEDYVADYVTKEELNHSYCHFSRL